MRATTVITTLAASFSRATPVLSFPVPREYQRIHEDLYGFLVAARGKADLETTHRSYTMCQGVFQVFRRRLDVKEAIRFSNALPAGIRALFVADWDDQDVHLKDAAICSNGETSGKLPFGSRSAMTEEVRRLRSSHNFAPESAISDVAYALRKIVDEQKLDNVLETLPIEATEFWTPMVDDNDVQGKAESYPK